MAMTILLVAGGGAVLALALARISRVLALLLGEENGRGFYFAIRG